MGSRLTFELAVRVTLADLARFTALENDGYVIETDRWHQLEEDLERLHHMAITASGQGIRA